MLAERDDVEAMRAAMDEALAVPGPTSTEMARALLACLRAGQDAGGDSRGQQSAAVLVADTLAAIHAHWWEHPRLGKEIGRLLGAGGSALYTYKLNPKKTRYYKVRRY